MNYFIIIAMTIITIFLIMGVVVYVRGKANPKNQDILGAENLTPIASNGLIPEYGEGGIITIPIERLPATTHIEESNLFEISDRRVIARISETLPIAVDTAARTLTNTALKNANVAADLAVKNANAAIQNANKVFQNGDIYKVIIPSGATLADSKQMQGAVRAIYHGPNGIEGQANLVKVDAAKLVKANPASVSKATKVANGLANVMNVASLVVGQYYMSEINSKIETLNKSVNKIIDFQEREFKSRILALIALVREISNFSSEIMESDDLRNRKLQTLEDLKKEDAQLLQQVNITIDEIIKKNQRAEYKEYQERTVDITLLLEYQQVLLTVLENICKLTNLLGKGKNSIEMSYFIFNTYWEQSNQIRVSLEEWHQNQAWRLGIDIRKNRRSKKGFESLITAIPSLFKDDWNYKELEAGVGEKISTQKDKNQLAYNEPEDVYGKDVPIIIKDAKYYYLREISDMVKI